jgi:hypothetical protein
MLRTNDTRLARAAKTQAPHDLEEPRRRSLLRARAALAAMLRERPPPDAGRALARVFQLGESAANQLAEVPDTAGLRKTDQAKLATDHAGVEEAFVAQLLRLILQYRDGREIDAANASPAELLGARLAGAGRQPCPTRVPPPSPPAQAGESQGGGAMDAEDRVRERG